MKNRVEFHCHTTMSKMDGVSSPQEIIEYAYEIGLSGVAITDHGNIQAFSDIRKLAKRYQNTDFKILYGLEAYIVDDEVGIVWNDRGQLLTDEFVVVDVETTGFSPRHSEIIQVSLVKVKDNKIVDTYYVRIKPKAKIPEWIIELTEITNELIENAPSIEDVLPIIREFCGNAVMVAHNAFFDMSFLEAVFEKENIEWRKTFIDTQGVAKLVLADCEKYSIDQIAEFLNIEYESNGTALDDAVLVAKIFMELRDRLLKAGKRTISELKSLGVGDVEYIKKLPMYHASIIAKNRQGMKALKKIVSESNSQYYRIRPRVPKSLLRKLRADLLIGTGCEAGELIRALVGGKSEKEIERIQEFYDYFEIQPLSNNWYMIEDERFESIRSEQDLRRLNVEVVNLAKRKNKLVVADCDVHFAKMEDSIKRVAVREELGFENPEEQAALFLRNTSDMLKEFDYLEEDAVKVVIDNTLLLAEKIEPIQ